jgi:hypothetical protein
MLGNKEANPPSYFACPEEIMNENCGTGESYIEVLL